MERDANLGYGCSSLSGARNRRKYEQTTRNHKRTFFRIIRKRIDGTYKNEPTVTLD